MFGFKFLGNTHVPHHKNTAESVPVKMPAPKEVLLPMSQHIGAPATPIVKVGDEVLTCGLGSVYPRDLVIGKVVEVKIDSYSIEKIAVIEWSVDVDSLKYVMIVTDKGVSPSAEQ